MRTVTGLLALGLFFLPPSMLFPGQAEATAMEAQPGLLPDAVGGWKLAGPPRVIDPDNIFDYMNGAGELYLAYHFEHMLAWEYHDGSGNDIQVELYRMKGSDDAFGLLSLDWDGEAIAWKPGAQNVPVPGAVPQVGALYGAGLLRLWSDNIYARIMSVRETPEARAAILNLGKAVIAGRSDAQPPALLKLLPAFLAPHWEIQSKRTAFFRSHLVLNSLYYLSHENILSLDNSCEAAFTSYEARGKRFHLTLLHFPDEARMMSAVTGFIKSYLPDLFEEGLAMIGTPMAHAGLVEDGWLGFKAMGSCLALVLACPDRETVLGALDQLRLDKP